MLYSPSPANEGVGESTKTRQEKNANVLFPAFLFVSYLHILSYTVSMIEFYQVFSNLFR